MITVLLLTAVVSACVGAPQGYSAPPPPPPASYSAPGGGSSSGGSRSSGGGRGGPFVAILRDERIQPEGGAYSFSVETEDGISRSESGSPVQTAEGVGSAMSGQYSFTLPDGQLFTMQYVADENGFQAKSPFLPVAPAFPHPIPAHALEQIEFARQQRERGETPDSGRYNPGPAPSAPSAQYNPAPAPAPPASSYRRPN